MSRAITRTGLTALLLAFTVPVHGEDPTQGPTLYTVGYAHLDTQWRWCYPQVIREYIPNTLHTNFNYFNQYPHYVFNFSGANRYRMMKEYWPADYATMKQYVAAGRWFPCGSSMEECDVNVPAAESIIRQVLYGNHYFRSELGTASEEFMLPDCFGFPASLPSLLSHCGLKGFSTQKLTWGSAVGIPFNVGVWTGLDGSQLLAAFNPGSYGGSISSDLSSSSSWLQRINATGTQAGVYCDYMYYGTGDVGGGPSSGSVQWLETSLAGTGAIDVVSARADQMFLDIPPANWAALPHYQGDLLLTQHSAGSITSQGYMKRWNHKNELLADAAERAAILAEWIGGPSYPRPRLNDAWTLVMGGQFHDILPGTSHPKAYEYSWNDEVLAMNQFASVLDASAATIATALNTQAQGVPVVVYNPLANARQDVVEATLAWPGATPAAVRVVGPEGSEVPSQIVSAGVGRLKVLFLAALPSLSFSVYDVRAAAVPAASSLLVSTSSLENARYRVTIDSNSDVSSIYDKTAGRAVLSAPARLAISRDFPSEWPAWNMDWSDAQLAPQAYVTGPATVEVVENGAARVAVKITRDTQDSHFVQTIRLAAGDAGNRIEFANTIDWGGQACNLKATFPLSVANANATYNWEVGTIQRGNNSSSKYEVPTHQWMDLTSLDNTYGATVLTDSKYGSDKPNNQTLRLTLLRTPGASGNYQDQATQDWGRHEILYGLAGHTGGWRTAQTDWQAMRMSQPPIAFQTTAHTGPLGKSQSLLIVNNPRVRVMAVKKAEDSDEVIIRLVELNGQPANGVRVAFPTAIAAAREVDGQERPIRPATVTNGSLAVDLTGYQLRTFALTLGAAPAQLAPTQMQAVTLPYNRAVTSNDGQAGVPGFDSVGRCLPAEMLPQQIAYRGITFDLGPTGGGQLNAVRCAGQDIPLPAGSWNRLYLLAAAADSDQTTAFHVDGVPVPLTVQAWGGYIGQWDNRVWGGSVSESAFSWPWPLVGIDPAYIRPDPVAWYCSHRHTPAGANDYYAYSYLFAYAIDLPGSAATLTLPFNERVTILAATMAIDPGVGTFPAQSLIDEVQRTIVQRPVMRPLAATGWNQDVIVERTATPPYQHTTRAFDPPNSWTYYERGLAGSAKGLPEGGTFVSLADGKTEVQLQPYDVSNVLFLNGNGGPTSATLTLAPTARRPYESLAIFAASANASQDSTGTVTITFTDESVSDPLVYNGYDWFFATSNNAIYDLGRVHLNTGPFEDSSSGNPRIYQTTLDLAALGLNTKPIESLTFTLASGSNSRRTTAIFAISGASLTYPGDLNGDTFVDVTDLAIFEACTTGPSRLYDPGAGPPGCPLTPDTQGHLAADFDRDGDIDQEDFGILQRCFGETGIPADPKCAD